MPVPGVAVLAFPRHPSGELPYDLGLEPARLAVRPLQSIEELVGRQVAPWSVHDNVGMGAVERSLAAHANTLRRGTNRVPCARPFRGGEPAAQASTCHPGGSAGYPSDRLQDLQRIFDGPVDVIETSSTDPAVVHAAALSIAADAIVIDVVSPQQLAAIIGGVRSHLMLRPTFEQLRTSRGELQPVFAGYARLSPDGNWTRLDDGALRIVE